MKKRLIRYGNVVSLRLPEDLWRLVKEEAEYRYSPPSVIIREALAEYYEARGKLQRKKP